MDDHAKTCVRVALLCLPNLSLMLVAIVVALGLPRRNRCIYHDELRRKDKDYLSSRKTDDDDEDDKERTNGCWLCRLFTEMSVSARITIALCRHDPQIHDQT